MKYLPKSVAHSVQAAPKRKMAIRWITSTTSDGMRILDEIFIVEEVLREVRFCDGELSFHRTISTIIICYNIEEKDICYYMA
jgi:hypothetical protein